MSEQGGEDFSTGDGGASTALTQKEVRRAYLNDLSEIATIPAAARVLLYLVEDMGTFDDAWSDKNAKMAKAVVLKDFGGRIMADIALAAPNAHEDIQRMERARRKRADELLTQT